MNGYCKILGCYFGAQFDPSDDKWHAIQVHHDGNPVDLGGPFDTEDQAECCAGAEHQTQLESNSQFGAGA
jgi:hypothetical protein